MLKLDINKIGPGGQESDSDQSELMEIERSVEDSPGIMRLQTGNGQVAEVPEEGPECYTNRSFTFLESSRNLNKWFSKSNGIGHKSVSSTSISTSAEIGHRRRKVRRLVDKNGDLRVINIGLEDRNLHFLKDGFTTLVDLRWRYTLVLFAASFFISWTIFAGLWHTIFWAHGDLLPEHLPALQGQNKWTPCVFEIHDFTSTFLYSVETQHTIGYGLRGSSHKCPDTVLLQCVQSIVGVIIQACMAGIVFAKLARPKRRAQTVMFSKNAVISKRNGLLRLMFRVANVRSSQLLESHYKGIILCKVTTSEGETIKYHQTEVSVSWQLDDEDDDPEDYGHLLLPVVISHTIDKESPLYQFTPGDLLNAKLEYVVTLEGVVEPSGNTTQARTSYLPDEILWGYHFRNCVAYAKKENVYAVDLSKLNSVCADNTPRMSAEQLYTSSVVTSPTKSKGTSRRSSSFEQTSLITRKREDALETTDEHPIKMIDEE